MLSSSSQHWDHPGLLSIGWFSKVFGELTSPWPPIVGCFPPFFSNLVISLPTWNTLPDAASFLGPFTKLLLRSQSGDKASV